MKKGIFFVFDGPDGAGKTTQLERAYNYLSDKKYPVIRTREPGGTRIGDKIREIILNPDFSEMDKVAEALLYAAARRQHVQQLIRPAVSEGKIVLCDRFLSSSIAYQGCGRGIGVRVIRDINAYAVEDCYPDYTFIFDVSAETGLQRARRRNSQPDRLEKEHIDFHSAVREAYLAIAAKEPEKYIIIDAGRDEESVFANVAAELENCLMKWGA